MSTITEFRTGSVRASQNLRVDRQNLKIYGLVAMQAGVEAIGYGFMSDRKTLEMLVALANPPNRRPIRCRFGHPGMSENATGKQLGYTLNYRIEENANGTFLVHDTQLLEAARKSPAFGNDPIDFVMTIAETAPTEFGESVVIYTDLAWVLADGSEVAYYDDEGDPTPKPKGAKYDRPVIRPAQFWYCDFVNEGALTHRGLFAAGVFEGHSSAYLQELFGLVDRWRGAYNIPLAELPEKINRIMFEYLASRKDKKSMPVEELTTNDLLDSAEATLAELSAAPEAESGPSLGDQVAELTGQVERLTKGFAQLTALVAHLQKAFAYQAGAPTVAPVAMTAPAPMAESFAVGTPVPTITPAAPATPAAQTPLQRSVEAQKRRAGRRA